MGFDMGLGQDLQMFVVFFMWSSLGFSLRSAGFYMGCLYRA